MQSSYSLEEYPVLQKWTRRSKKFVFFSSIASGVTTYGGFQTYAMGGGDGLFHSVFGPLLLTSISFSLSVFGYSYLYERYPLARNQDERARLHIIILFITAVLLVTSSYFSVISLGGPRCLERKLQADLMKAEQVFDEIVKLRRMEEGLVGPLKLAAEKSGVLADGERNGTLSRKTGEGKVLANVSALKKGYADIAEILEDSLAEHEDEAAEGRIILENIRGITNDETIDTKEKALMIAPLFNALNKQLTGLSISAVPSVVTAVQNIDDTNLARGQYMETALEAIKKPVQKTKQEILKQVTLIKQHREPVVPHFHIVDAEQAVFAFPEAALFAVAFATSVDAGIPIFCLFCLFFIGRRESNRQLTAGWNYGTNYQIGATGARPQPDANPGSLWTTNHAANRQRNKPRADCGDRPKPPAA